MKFKLGDATDRALCAAISHEYLRCDDALHEFARLRQEMMTAGEDRRLSYTLNLSDFLTRYYRFLLDMHNAARHMWMQQGDQFPDWGEVTAFSVVVKTAVSPTDVPDDQADASSVV